MKVFAIGAVVVAAAATMPTTHGWWDNGHMLVGEVAAQLMDEADLATIKSVLSHWDEDFPNTSDPFSAAIWPDLLKCNKVQPYCQSPLIPSYKTMDEWHYIDLPYNVDGSKWHGKDADLELFKFTLGGEAEDVISKGIQALTTSKSLWVANLVIRNFIHIFGDLHQPLHTLAGVSEANEDGDEGGNKYDFPRDSCGFGNLHQVWDAAAGIYSTTNWAPNSDSFYPELQKNASELIEWLPAIHDAVDLTSYKEKKYSAFVNDVQSNHVFKNIVLDSYSFASVVYGGLDLNYDADGKVPCPDDKYLKWAQYVAQLRIAIGGKRLSVFLSQFAAQMRSQGLAK